MKTFTSLLLAGATALSLSACSTGPDWEQKTKQEGQYWQRASASSALYMRGPKAQHMLNQDIADCAAELKELYHLGALRMGIPGDKGTKDSPQNKMSEWETPRREGPIYAEYYDYTDFESCMTFKGWERTEYLPYDIANQSREDYLQTMIGQKRQTNFGHRDRPLKKKLRSDYNQ